MSAWCWYGLLPLVVLMAPVDGVGGTGGRERPNDPEGKESAISSASDEGTTSEHRVLPARGEIDGRLTRIRRADKAIALYLVAMVRVGFKVFGEKGVGLLLH